MKKMEEDGERCTIDVLSIYCIIMLLVDKYLISL